MTTGLDEKLPYLFLDIDGCLNAFGFNPTNEWGDNFEVYVETSQGQRFKHVLSKAMGINLAELPVETIWLTTWTHDAYKVGQHIGLDMNQDWKVLSWEDLDLQHKMFVGNWKQECLIKQLQEDPRDFIWVDDNAIYDASQKEVEAVAVALGVRPLFIIPKDNCGISPIQIKEMQEFLGD